jgi:hypothetical protein
MKHGSIDPFVILEGAVRALPPGYAFADAAEHAASDTRYEQPPCMECGANDPKEAEAKCICAGDKDDCHGCHLWADAP